MKLKRSSLRKMIGADGELRLPLDTDPRKDKPISAQVFWRRGRIFTLIVIALIWAVYQIYARLPRNDDPLTMDGYETLTDEITVEAIGEWQNSRLIAQPGDILVIEYRSGKWKSYQQEFGEDASGGYRCDPDQTEIACNEIIKQFPWAGMIARVGRETPFQVGNYVRRVLIRGGEIELRINDTGMSDNSGALTMRITLLRPIATPAPPTATPMPSPTPVVNLDALADRTPLPATWTPAPSG